MANYIDDLQTFTNAAILKIAEQRRLLRLARAAGEGGYEYIDNIIWWNQLVTGANDTNQTEELRLRLLTLLVDNAQLNTNVPVDIINLYQPFIFNSGSGPVLWGGIGGNINDQTDLIAKFNTYLPLAAGSSHLVTETIFFGTDDVGIDVFNEGDTLNIGFSAGVIQFGADSEARFNLITAGNWQGTAIAPAYGGLGVQVLTGQAGKAVVVNGAGTGYQLATLAGGDVSWIGGLSVDNSVARFDSTTGKIIQGSPVIIADNGAVSAVRSITFNGTTSGFASISPPAIAGSSVQALQAASGTLALLENNLGQFASTTSAQLLAKISDANGTGTLVFGTSPSLTTPNIGAATGTSLSIVGPLTIGDAGDTAGRIVLKNEDNVTTQTIRGTNPTTSIIYDLPTTAPTAGQYMSASAPAAGVVTLSWATLTALVNPMTTLGDIIYGAASGVATRLAGNTTTTNKFLRSTGAAGVATAPSFEVLVAGDIPTIAQSQVSGLVTALTNKLSTTLTDGYFLLGNAANAAVGVLMSQDGTLDNTGALTIADEAITFAKMQNITYQTLMGRWSAGDGPPQEITIGSGLSLSGVGVLTATGGGGGTPGGSSGEMQWNNASAFDGYARMITDGSDLWMQAGNFYLSDNAVTPTKTVNFDVSAVTGAKTWAFPDASDTFVGRDATQTLTNKTLTSPVVTTGLTTGSTTFALLNTTATTINFAGAATTLAIGAATGTVTLNNATVALTATPATSASFSTATILTRASGGNLEKIVASGGGTTNFLRADGTWAAPAGGGGLTIGTSTITSGTIGRILFEGTSNLLQQSANLFWDNTNARLSLGFGASPTARLSLAAAAASAPHFLLTPSTAAFTGTTDGMLTYQTVTGVSNLVLYKGTGATNILTAARNSDFATGSASGVLVADTAGTITQSADLTALGIFAASDTVTLAGTTTSATTLVSTSLVGSKTLPASFFGVGKTIEFKVSGLLTLDNSQTITFRVSLAGAPLNIDVVLDHNNTITSKYFEYTVRITCKAISGSNSTYIYSAVVHGQHDATGEGITYGTSADSGTIAINTAATIATDISAFFSASNASNSFVVYNAVATYLN